MPYTFLALIAVTGLLALIPTRRLFLAGWSSRALLAYFLAVVALGLVVAELRGPARFLTPILVVVYIAPFVTARAGLTRLFDRASGGRRPVVVRPVDLPSLPDPGESLSSSVEGAVAPARPEAEAAGSEAAGTEAAGSEAAGTEAAGSEAAGTEAAGSEAAGTEAAAEPIGEGAPEDDGRA